MTWLVLAAPLDVGPTRYRTLSVLRLISRASRLELLLHNTRRPSCASSSCICSPFRYPTFLAGPIHHAPVSFLDLWKFCANMTVFGSFGHWYHGLFRRASFSTRSFFLTVIFICAFTLFGSYHWASSSGESLSNHRLLQSRAPALSLESQDVRFLSSS